MNKYVMDGDDQSPVDVERWIESHGRPGAVIVLRFCTHGVTEYVLTQILTMALQGMCIDHPVVSSFTRDGSLTGAESGECTRLLMPTAELLDVVENGVRHIHGLSYSKSRTLGPKEEVLLTQARGLLSGGSAAKP